MKKPKSTGQFDMNTAQQVHVLCELGNAALQSYVDENPTQHIFFNGVFPNVSHFLVLLLFIVCSSDTDSMASDQDFKKPDLPGIGARRIKSDEAEIPDEAANKVQDITPEVKNPVIEKQIPLQYKEPSWSGRPSSAYKIEVLKSGVILETIDLHEKNYHVIGRLPICDISLAHPTISRYHAILQYRQVDDEKNSKGLYLYDLDSTHGTFWNGYRVRPNTYVKLQGGHIIRFGCSQRKFIVQTPEEDIQQESELTITELKVSREKKKNHKFIYK